METVRIAHRGSEKDKYGDVREVFGNAVAVQGSVYPVSDGATAAMYGEKASSMKKIIVYDECAAFANDGLWLQADEYAPGSQKPPWHVVSFMPWTHCTVILIVKEV